MHWDHSKPIAGMLLVLVALPPPVVVPAPPVGGPNLAVT